MSSLLKGDGASQTSVSSKGDSKGKGKRTWDGDAAKENKKVCFIVCVPGCLVVRCACANIRQTIRKWRTFSASSVRDGGTCKGSVLSTRRIGGSNSHARRSRREGYLFLCLVMPVFGSMGAWFLMHASLSQPL